MSSSNPVVFLHLGGPAGHWPNMLLWPALQKEVMCLSLHLAIFHFPNLKTLGPNRKGSYCMMEGKNRAERNSGPRSGRVLASHQFALCNTEAVVVHFISTAHMLSAFPSSMKGTQCILSLLGLSLPPRLTLLEPQCQVSHIAAASAPPSPSETAWAEEGGGGEGSSWPSVYKKRFTLGKCIPWLLSFLYTSSQCVVLHLVKEAEAVPEKLLLPVPISTFSVRMPHCQGAPVPGRLLLASYKQHSGNANPLYLRLFSQSIPLPQEMVRFGAAESSDLPSASHRAARNVWKRLLLVKTTDDRWVQDRNMLSHPKEDKFLA